jgi:hypothetical protein
MTEKQFILIRAKAKRELSGACGCKPDVKLLAAQYVSGLIDAVSEVSLRWASDLRRMKTEYNNSWACE